MLAQHHRLRSSRDFTTTVRNGCRVGTRTLVVHYLPADPALAIGQNLVDVQQDKSSDSAGGKAAVGQAARVGFIVSRAVGGSVTRKRVTRRLRHIAKSHIGQLPVGSLLVVRALPRASLATSSQLDSDYSYALRKLSLTGTGGVG